MDGPGFIDRHEQKKRDGDDIVEPDSVKQCVQRSPIPLVVVNKQGCEHHYRKNDHVKEGRHKGESVVFQPLLNQGGDIAFEQVYVLG